MIDPLFPPIPGDTAKAALAVFGKSNFYLTVGDQANNLFSGLIVDDLLQRSPSSARRQALLYMITIFQFYETLPDYVVPDALRKRVDWKYALHLPMNFPGIGAASLCEFRKWLLVDSRSQQNLQALLTNLSKIAELNGRQPSGRKACEVLNRVCTFSRLAKIWETISQALEALARERPDRLRAISLPHWYERYGHHSKDINLGAESSEQEAFANAVGSDGFYLLEAVSGAGNLALADLPEILALKQVWQEQYVQIKGKLSWRKDACSGCLLISPGLFIEGV